MNRQKRQRTSKLAARKAYYDAARIFGAKHDPAFLGWYSALLARGHRALKHWWTRIDLPASSRPLPPPF